MWHNDPKPGIPCLSLTQISVSDSLGEWDLIENYVLCEAVMVPYHLPRLVQSPRARCKGHMMRIWLCGFRSIKDDAYHSPLLVDAVCESTVSSTSQPLNRQFRHSLSRSRCLKVDIRSSKPNPPASNEVQASTTRQNEAVEACTVSFCTTRR